MGNILNF